MIAGKIAVKNRNGNELCFLCCDEQRFLFLREDLMAAKKKAKAKKKTKKAAKKKAKKKAAKKAKKKKK